jgi:hypothetical protein
MLQVLWEHGFIDSQNFNQYTVTRRKGEMGILQSETSLKFLLGNCLDFEEEESLLQSKGGILGAKIDRTPNAIVSLRVKELNTHWDVQRISPQQPLKDKRKKRKLS